MSKLKINNNIFWVLFETLRIYFSNIDKFVTYMLFPVFGQIVGIILSLVLSISLAPHISEKFSNPTTCLIIIFLLSLPGLLIFIKAFWDYMIAYVSLNSMTEGYLLSDRIYDIAAHNAVATQRKSKFIMLIIVIGIFCCIGSSIFFIIPAIIAGIYFILIYQIFTFETEETIKGCFKSSFNLIKGSWFRTSILAIILAFVTIYLVSAGIGVIFDCLKLTEKICSLFNFIGDLLPLRFVNNTLLTYNLPPITNLMISRAIFNFLIMFITMGMTLPIRSICWTLWYFGLKDKTLKKSPKTKKQKEFEDE